MKIYNPRHLLNHLTTAVIQDFVVTRDYGDAIQEDWSLKDNELRKALVQQVRGDIGPTATPDHIQWAPGLPKTRSGKIMRRILRKIAEDAPEQLGDTSTLADPSVVESLVRNRRMT